MDIDQNISSPFNSSNEKCDSDSFHLDNEVKLGQSLAYAAILVFSFVGNSLIAIVCYREKNLRTTVDFFILNMACSDILFAITVVPRRITETLSTPFEWHINGFLGEVLCRMTHIVQDVSTTVSIESLVVIAFDRFRSIMFPLRTNIVTPSIRKIFIVLTWVVGFGFHAPYVYAWRLSSHKNKTFCIYSWGPFYEQDNASKEYFLVLSFFLFILPMVTMIILYSLVISKLRQRKVQVINHSSIQKNSWNRRTRNVLRTVIAVVVVFALSWLPFNISIYLILFYWDLNPSCVARTMVRFIVIFAHANNAINPYVIFGFSTNYRSGLKALFCSLKMRTRVKRTKAVAMFDLNKISEINLGRPDGNPPETNLHYEYMDKL